MHQNRPHQRRKNRVTDSSTTTVTRFGRGVNGVFDPLTELGGSLLQRFAIDPAVREVVPREANVPVQSGEEYDEAA